MSVWGTPHLHFYHEFGVSLYPKYMTGETYPRTLEEIRDFARAATSVGRVVAHFGLQAACSTSLYKEPGVASINQLDAQVGSSTDVQDPLLTAHRLTKFYVISSGDPLLSCCDLIARDYPLHIGSAALARSAAEHASRAMFLGDPSVDWKTRVLRAHELLTSGLQEYKSSDNGAATELIERWQKWRARTGPMFKGVPRPRASQNRNLIEKYFGCELAYDELSRPTHGNAVWLTLAVIQEQKRTNYAWSATLRNFCFALEACAAAGERLCELWNLDRDAILRDLAEKDSGGTLTWAALQEMCAWVRNGVNGLAANADADASVDPQPHR